MTYTEFLQRKTVRQIPIGFEPIPINGKLVSDALNGVAYDDDKCVVEASVRKFYSDYPRTQIIVCEAVNE